MSDLGTDAASERRRWGRFYTPPVWADLTLRLCLRDATERVLDPCCGDGIFLARAAAYKRHLDPTRDAAALGQELWGVEVDRDAADQAAQNLGLAAHIICADFFSLGAGELPMFDCVVGNPPYTRQEWLQELAPGGDKSALIHRALGQRSPLGGSAAWLTRRAGVHAYFFVHAARFMREGGRLGFIVSNSWLDVDYGTGLQAFFLNNFRVVAIVESQAERWFADASVNACLVILERCTDANARDDNLARFAQLLRSMHPDDKPDDWAALILSARSDERIRVRTIRQGDLRERPPVFGATQSRSRRWGALLRAPQVYLDALDRNRERLVPLRSLARIRRGYTTGANEFFYLDSAAADERGIEAEFLRPLVKSPRDCLSRVVNTAALPHVAFVVHRGKRSLAGTTALDYIRWGESQGFHARPTCAARERWYDIGERPPAHLAWIKGVWTRHFSPLLPGAGIALDQQLYGVELREPSLCKVIAALLNSTWAALCAELGGRVNFGEGILWIAAYEAGQLPLPDPARITDAQASALEAAFDALATRPVSPVSEEVTQADRHALDETVFDLLQLTRTERQAIRAAVVDLAQARLTRAKSVERRTKSVEKRE